MNIIHTLSHINGTVTICDGVAVLPNGEEIDLAAACNHADDFPPPCAITDSDVEKLATEAVNAARSLIQSTLGIDQADVKQAVLFARCDDHIRLTLEHYIRNALLIQ